MNHLNKWVLYVAATIAVIFFFLGRADFTDTMLVLIAVQLWLVNDDVETIRARQLQDGLKL